MSPDPERPDPERPDPERDPARDPVEGHIAALSAALRGPARVKKRLLREMRDGLTDTVEAYAREGVPHPRAARLAVRDFGTPEELAPSCQRELTIAQARHTARAIALTAPLLITCWHLLWIAGDGGETHLPYAAQLLAFHLAAVAAGATLLAAAVLATGALARRLPTPRRLPLAVAWTGTAASAAMGLATLTLAVSSLAAPQAADWPRLALAGVLTAASHTAVAASARACRTCARLPVAAA
jgi:hypothetical protein